MGAMDVSWSAARARRLQRHGLGYRSIAERSGSIADRVADSCGTHAQVMSAAELSIGIRCPGVTTTAVRDALGTQKSLVKTYGPRGTVHLLPTRDLAHWTASLSAMPQYTTAPPTIRMQPEQSDQVVAAIRDALLDGPLTIDELDAAVVGRTGDWAGELVMPAFNGWWPRWRQAIHLAAHRGALCFGEPRDRAITYASPAEHLGEQVSEEEGLEWMVRSYLHSYGPATPAQFAQWFGAPKTWVAPPFEQMSPVSLEGTPASVAPGDTQFDAGEPSGIRLLPYFDAYGIGSHPRDRVFPGTASTRALGRGQAGVYPIVLRAGEVAGVWHLKRAGKFADITVEPIGRLPKKELEEQADLIGEILSLTPRLTVGPVTVGPHA